MCALRQQCGQIKKYASVIILHNIRCSCRYCENPGSPENGRKHVEGLADPYGGEGGNGVPASSDTDEVGYAVADDEECTDGQLGESKEPPSPSGCPAIDLSKWEKIRIGLSTFSRSFPILTLANAAFFVSWVK